MTSFLSCKKRLFTAFSCFLLMSCAPTNEPFLASSVQSDGPQIQSKEVTSFPIVNEQVTLTIADKLAEKCVVLFPSSQREQKSCTSAALKLAQELDFNYIRRSNGVSAFVFLNTPLHALLSDSAVSDYLLELQKACLDAIYSNRELNLWSFTIEHSNGDEDLALKRVAVLFQDGAQTAAQIKFLLVEQHPLSELLSQTLDLLETGLSQKKIKAYPDGLNISRSALYHYYVPRYLARRLKNSNFPRELAAQLATIFNSVYELRQIQKAQGTGLPNFHEPINARSYDEPSSRKIIDRWNQLDELFGDLLDHLAAPLKPFHTEGQEENVQDLYLGYAGSLDGVDAAGLSVTLPEFTAAFSANPVVFFQKIIP